MIKDRMRVLYCIHCGGTHTGPNCPQIKKSNAPLETPSHNGPYRGMLPVRVLPPGRMSPMPELKFHESDRTIMVTVTCKCGCGQTFEKPKNMDKRFYSMRCRNRYYHLRSRENAKRRALEAVCQ